MMIEKRFLALRHTLGPHSCCLREAERPALAIPDTST